MQTGMDAQPSLAPAPPMDLAEALARAADLVLGGITAFLEGNPFRGRRVQEEARALARALGAWPGHAVWADGPGRQAVLASHAADMADAAQQLAGLAESRPSSRVPRELRDAVREVAQPLEALLTEITHGGGGDPTEALEAVRARRRRFLAAASPEARGAARHHPFASRLLAVAAVHRLQEAAEAAAAAALLLQGAAPAGDRSVRTGSSAGIVPTA